MRRAFFISILSSSIFCVSLVTFFCGCNRPKGQDYDVDVRFVDSTYGYSKEIYETGEIIYVEASEYFEAYMPDTVYIQIISCLGDTEHVKAGLGGGISVPETVGHVGCINSYGSSTYTEDNDTIEVRIGEDTLFAYYEVKGQWDTDTAIIKE